MKKQNERGIVMRLTAKLSENEYINNCFPTKIYNKLGKLEDIEEEIGIDLIFITTLKKFYGKKESSIQEYIIGVRKEEHVYVDFTEKCIRVLFLWDGWDYADHDIFYFKDYGKTWALTKEELE